MNIIEMALYWGFPFLIALTILVFFHELGHFWVARLAKVRVEVFSVGFGSELFGWNDQAGTRWKIGVIPLGGYVKMFGQSDLPSDEDEDEPPLTDEEKAVSFQHKTLAQRTAIVAAGPIANFLLSVVLIAGLMATFGAARPYAGVGEIMPGSAAAEAGFEVGDRIVSIDGEAVEWFSDLVRIVSVQPEILLKIKVRRGDDELVLTATPKRHQQPGAEGKTVEIGLLGVRYDPQQMNYERQTPLMAVWMGMQQTASLTEKTLSFLGQIISGRQGTEGIGGPLRIVQYAGITFQSGIENFILFLAVLSINLGLINLFPIPILDGGHLLFFAVEAIWGRPLGPRAQEYGFRFGLILVLILMVFVTWNDLVQLRIFEFIKELVT
ncbi:MAG: RIP metalloprotease RseP [Rhodospirillaceae bacterium]|jgi:regulator of sigma E protease|nr:RIP metalloprotease RseP [Rhodospirillaceae bacterium]|tara:strand:+ start:5306 stop:6445 length:1140 start_codon:yes stop_codon:yes gene_type:complete